MRLRLHHFIVPVIAATVLACAAGEARANGYCGVDFTVATGCPITSSAPVTGSLGPNIENEDDYFRFYARPHTALELTINDTENPICSTDQVTYGCGNANATLYNGRGQQVASTEFSSPSNGIAVPQNTTAELAGGEYYVDVNLESGAQGLSYSLTAQGTPAVTWPAPCVVPHVSSGETLASIERRVRDNRCAVGRIVHRRDPRVHDGVVLGLRPGPGTDLTAGSRVEIIIAGTPHRRHR